MRTGEVDANLVRLNAAFGLSYIPELVAHKTASSEKAPWEIGDPAFHHREYLRLRRDLEEASQASALPDAPLGRSALNDLLVRLRLKWL